MKGDGLKPDNSRKYDCDADGGYTDCYICCRPIWVNGSPGLCSIICNVCDARLKASREWDDKMKAEALRLTEELEKDTESLSMPELATRLTSMHEALDKMRADKEAAIAKAVEDAEALLDPPAWKVAKEERRKQKERERRERLVQECKRRAKLGFNYALCDGFPGASAQVTGFDLDADALEAGQKRWDSLSDEDKRYAQAGVSLAVVDVMNNVVKDWSLEERERVFGEQSDAIRAELRDKVAREEDGYVKVPAWRMHYPLPEERAYGVMEQDIGEPGAVLKLWPSDCAPMLDRMADSPLPEDADMVARVKAKQKEKEEPE